MRPPCKNLCQLVLDTSKGFRISLNTLYSHCWCPYQHDTTVGFGFLIANLVAEKVGMTLKRNNQEQCVVEPEEQSTLLEIQLGYYLKRTSCSSSSQERRGRRIWQRQHRETLLHPISLPTGECRSRPTGQMRERERNRGAVTDYLNNGVHSKRGRLTRSARVHHMGTEAQPSNNHAEDHGKLQRLVTTPSSPDWLLHRLLEQLLGSGN